MQLSAEPTSTSTSPSTQSNWWTQMLSRLLPLWPTMAQSSKTAPTTTAAMSAASKQSLTLSLLVICLFMWTKSSGCSLSAVAPVSMWVWTRPRWKLTSVQGTQVRSRYSYIVEITFRNLVFWMLVCTPGFSTSSSSMTILLNHLFQKDHAG